MLTEMRKLIAFFLLSAQLFCLSSCAAVEKRTGIKVLILPKFEVGELSGDFPGEAQYYYEAFLTGGEEYVIPDGGDGYRLYVKDGIALVLTGMGKVNAALTAMSVLTDERFDFSDAYVLSVGCAGSARDTTVMGDVFVITAAVDYDMGHHADSRELENENSGTWFHDSSYDDDACVQLDPVLMDRVYALVKDVPLKTTDNTRHFMSEAFDGADWAVRDPRVLRGTSVTGDNYWKGEFDHQNALLITDTYHCPDPYAATEMEDIAVARTMERLGMLDRLIILRTSVDMDVFMLGSTPERLWDPETDESLASEESTEGSDIFATAMANNYAVGSVIIEAILNDELRAD